MFNLLSPLKEKTAIFLGPLGKVEPGHIPIQIQFPMAASISVFKELSFDVWVALTKCKWILCLSEGQL